MEVEELLVTIVCKADIFRVRIPYSPIFIHTFIRRSSGEKARIVLAALIYGELLVYQSFRIFISTPNNLSKLKKTNKNNLRQLSMKK